MKTTPAKKQKKKGKSVRKALLSPNHDPVTGKFAAGNHANDAGRPAGVKNFTTKVREALDKIYEGTEETWEQLLIKRILKKAVVDGNERMIQLIWEQFDGKAMQKVMAKIETTVTDTTISKKSKATVAQFNTMLREALNQDDEDSD